MDKEPKLKNDAVKPVRRGNFVVNILKFVFFWVGFCFLVTLSKSLFAALIALDTFNVNTLFLAMIAAFIFYTFIADLNDVYKRVQEFFSHSTILSYFLPFSLLAISLGYLIVPRLFNAHDFDRGIFIFLGGFILTAHMMYIARENKGKTFSEFSHYLAVITFFAIINLIFFVLYLRIAFAIDVSSILADGFVDGWQVLNNLALQLFTQVPKVST